MAIGAVIYWDLFRIELVLSSKITSLSTNIKIYYDDGLDMDKRFVAKFGWCMVGFNGITLENV